MAGPDESRGCKPRLHKLRRTNPGDTPLERTRPGGPCRTVEPMPAPAGQSDPRVRGSRRACKGAGWAGVGNGRRGAAVMCRSAGDVGGTGRRGSKHQARHLFRFVTRRDEQRRPLGVVVFLRSRSADDARLLSPHAGQAGPRRRFNGDLVRPRIMRQPMGEADDAAFRRGDMTRLARAAMRDIATWR